MEFMSLNTDTRAYSRLRAQIWIQKRKIRRDALGGKREMSVISFLFSATAGFDLNLVCTGQRVGQQTFPEANVTFLWCLSIATQRGFIPRRLPLRCLGLQRNLFC